MRSRPGCRSLPTPRPSPSLQDCARGNCGDMLATATTLVQANDGEASTLQPVLSSDPVSVTVTGSTPTGALVRPGHRARLDHGHRDGDRRVGRAQPRHRRPPADLLVLRVGAADRRRAAGDDRGLHAHHLLHEVVEHDRMHRPVEQLRPRRLRLPRHARGQVRGGERAERAVLLLDRQQRPSDCAPRRLLASGSATSSCLPLFEESGDTGSNAWYHVHGYAAFNLTGYHLGGQYSTTPSRARQRTVRHRHVRPLCRAVRRLELQPDAPQLGASILRLIR